MALLVVLVYHNGCPKKLILPFFAYIFKRVVKNKYEQMKPKDLEDLKIEDDLKNENNSRLIFLVVKFPSYDNKCNYLLFNSSCSQEISKIVNG